MLQKNPLLPPRPPRPDALRVRGSDAVRRGQPFVSAEDFDATGILAGIDPCESRYWWLPDLTSSATPAFEAQAASRSRPPATA